MNQDETYETLLKKLAEQGADLLIKTILGCVAAQGQSLLQRTVLFPDNIKPREQDHTKATYTKLITKEDGQIDWSSSSREIYNQWRAYQPWPGVFTWMGGKRVKILSLYLSPLARGEMQEGGVTTAQRTPPPNRSRASTGRPSPSDPLTRGRKFGSIQSLDNHLLVLCGDDNYLEILSLQPEGKKILTAGEFVRGYKVERFETFPLLDKEG